MEWICNGELAGEGQNVMRKSGGKGEVGDASAVVTTVKEVTMRRQGIRTSDR